MTIIYTENAKMHGRGWIRPDGLWYATYRRARHMDVFRAQLEGATLTVLVSGNMPTLSGAARTLWKFWPAPLARAYLRLSSPRLRRGRRTPQ